MRRIPSSFMVLALLLAFPLCAHAQVLADKVPNDSLITVAWRGSDNLGPQYANSNLKGTLEATHVAVLLQKYIPMLTDLISAQNPQAGNTTKLLLSALPAMLKHPTAFCFRGLAPAQETTPPLPLIYLICQTGDQTDVVYKQLQDLIDSLPQKVPTLALEKSTGQITLQIGGTINTGSAVGGAIINISSPLAGNPAFQTAMAQVQKDPILWSYVDTPGMLKLITTAINTYAPPEFRAKWPTIRAAMGTDGVGPLASSEGFDGKDWQSLTFLQFTGPRTGLLAMADYQPVTDAMLRRIPKAATTASAARLDLAKFFTAIHDAVLKTDANAGKQFDLYMHTAQTTTGVDLEKGLIDTFGDEWISYSTEFHGTSLLGSTMINKMRDAKTAALSLAALEVAGQKTIDQFAGSLPPGQSITLNHVKDADLDITVLTMQNQQLCYTINGDYFYFAPDPGMITSAVDHITTKGESILKNDTFQAMRQRLNIKDALSVQYADLPTIVPEFLTTVRGLLVMVRMAGITVPPDILPTNESLQPYLTPSMTETWTDPAGWHARGIGPFPGAAL